MKRIFLIGCIFSTLIARSQYPSFKPLRYDDDFSMLKNDSAANWYQHIKYKPLSKNKNTYLSFGGDIRYQYLHFNNEDWGDGIQDKNGFILTRYLLHSDFHKGNIFRTFIQLQSSLANSRKIEPSPVEENQLDLHQAFFDICMKHFTLRTGRQEFLYGSQRLVSVREGPNNRQSFDAIKMILAVKNVKTDLFFSHYVKSKQEIFDDGFNKHTKFWGVYSVVNKIPGINNFDIYYFGLWKRSTSFDDGTGRELRHNIGTRLWNSSKHFRYDAEAVYQFGAFSGKQIKAYTVSLNTGYKFSKTKFKPEIGIKTELISGDKNYNDDKLQTFNPLFPRGGYFGLISLIGPSNLMDIHPSLAVELTKKTALNIDYDIFWRYTTSDGVYGPNVLLIYSGKNSLYKKIGNQLSADIVYTPNNFLYFRVEIARFTAGNFLKAVGPGKNITFLAATAQLKF